MPPVGFEHTTPTGERPQTYALGYSYIGARTDTTKQINVCLGIHCRNVWLHLTLRRLMSYIYIYIYMEHPFLMFLDHTQRRSTVGRTPLDE